MLPRTPADLDRFLTETEGPTLECKEAKGSYDPKKLRRYLCALANEGGGYLVLGVTDEPPRRVVGSKAFANVQSDIRAIRQSLTPSPEVRAAEVAHPDGRVLVFKVGSRKRGQVVRYDRIRWVRDGESLTDMDDARLKAVLLEQTDVTAETCSEATFDDLDLAAIERFREGVVQKARGEDKKRRFAQMHPEELVRSAQLVRRGGDVTKAAILLLGTEEALDRWVPNSEVVFEYRTEADAPRYDDRLAVREPLILAVDTLWEAIRPYARLRPIETQDGTRVTRSDRFAERSVREALLNAVAHRDYFDAESVRVRMSPDALEVTSPGPFPPTITPENVADEQHRRNRKLAEALDKCGEIERSGQGVDLMIEAAVQRAQALPTFEEPNGEAVRVTLHGGVDQDALNAVSQIAEDVWAKLGPSELAALDAVRRGVARRDVPVGAAQRLLALGLIEPGGPGDTPYRYAAALRSPTEHWTERLTDVLSTLLTHSRGLRLAEVKEAMGDIETDDLKQALQWLRRNGLAYTTGRTRGTRWHAGTPGDSGGGTD